MSKIQKTWLYCIAGFSILHLIRDVLQDVGVNMWLTTVLASPGPPKVGLVWYWTIFNTYAFALIQLIVVARCLKTNRFGRLGNFSVGLAGVGVVVWVVYYYLL